MNPSPNDLDRLQRLLKCKRYEAPPPGYFDDFAERVIVRLERANTARTSSWWVNLFAGLEVKPLLVGAYGVAVCGLLLFGISISQMDSGALAASDAKAGGVWWTAPVGSAESSAGESALYSLPLPLASLSSMAPVIKERASIFRGDGPAYQIEPVHFNFRNR
ncbi:MAG: hypothetical protein ACYDH9_23880 [Limisphaerales bacterium]